MGWGIRALIPLEDLGRLKMPSYRIRYKDGWVRLGLSRDKRCLVATLEDRDGKGKTASTHLEACIRAVKMGNAIAYHLMKHNRYEIGDTTGDASKIMMAMA